MEDKIETPDSMSVVLDSGQFAELISAVEQVQQETAACHYQLYGLWLLLIIMVVFECRRVLRGIRQKVRSFGNV